MKFSSFVKMGKNVKGLFFIEYNPKTNQGGTTHSLAYYKEGTRVIWLENAWEKQRGLHVYGNVNEMIKDIKKKHFQEQRDKQYSEIEFGVFEPGEHKIGETLQELVDICLK